MDGLDVVQPLGAPEFRQLRDGIDHGQTADTPAPHDLDGFFALHPGLGDLMPLWRSGELGFVHAVSTPYRDKRSHFEGQDILEAGTGPDDPRGIRDGWLNRLLQSVPGIEAETAFAIGRSDMLLTRGPATVANWSPDAAFTLSPQARLLLDEVMHDDPLFRDTMLEAMALSDGAMPRPGGVMSDAMMGDMRQSMRAARQSGGTADIARFAADKLRGDTRIAAFSLNGFDTHARQINTLPRALSELETAILTLREGLGAVWDRTTVVAMTEFGRTARLNGTRGTDHGTGGAMLLAGGALRGGRVIGDWPGLSEADLYERRDLRPTRDVRAHAAWIMRQSFGLERATLEDAVFPGLDMGPDPRLLL
jgi:uncharacterized protein (DUF1501 family)